MAEKARSSARRFSMEGTPKPARGGKKRKAETARIRRRQEEGFSPLSWVDPETGKKVRLSQMGRRNT